MENILSSFLKKQALPEDTHLVIGQIKRSYLYKQTHLFIQTITPTRIIQNKKVFEITHIDELYHLDGFEISTEKEKILNVRLFGFHPNCDPDTDIFCLPDFKKGIEFNQSSLNMIITNIKTYYLDSSYFNPLGRDVKCRELPSAYIPKEEVRKIHDQRKW